MSRHGAVNCAVDILCSGHPPENTHYGGGASLFGEHHQVGVSIKARSSPRTMNAFEGIRLNPRLASLCVRTDTPDGTWYGSCRVQEREDIIAFNSMIGPSMVAQSLWTAGVAEKCGVINLFCVVRRIFAEPDQDDLGCAQHQWGALQSVRRALDRRFLLWMALRL